MLLLPACALLSQQLPLMAQYRYAQGMLNPASVSSDFFLYEYNLNAVAATRLQWFSQPETPRTSFASLEYVADVGQAFDLAMGANLIQDRTGPTSFTGIYGRLASVFTRDPYFGGFGVGLSYGFVQYQVDAGRIAWKDPDDPNIPLENLLVTRPDVGVGLFYYKRVGGGLLYQDNIYFGLSAPQLLGGYEAVRSGNQWVDFRRVPHVYATAGWYHFFNEDIFMELSAWGKYAGGAPLNLDINARLQPGRTLWVGIGGNINGMMHLEAGLNLPGLLGKDTNCKIGYAFDYNLSAFNLPFGAAHELVLSVQLDTY
jgi:type IX secretion system PorP/SprF family membrane protein